MAPERHRRLAKFCAQIGKAAVDESIEPKVSTAIG